MGAIAHLSAAEVMNDLALAFLGGAGTKASATGSRKAEERFLTPQTAFGMTSG